MKGRWNGFYKYDKQSIQDRIGVEKTNFTITIDKFENNYFTGNVEDDLSTKGSPGIGEISGSISDGKIKFIKQMPIKAIITLEGKMQTYDEKKHRPIYYEGVFSNNEKTIKGTWKMKFGISIVSIFIILLTTKGTWQMDFIE